MATSCKRKCENDSDHEEFNAKDLKMDEIYFNSYAHIDCHEDMLSDSVRTLAYRNAILKNYKLFLGKNVADVGAGTGILSIFCVHAGAKKVFAVEASSMAEQTSLVVAENNMKDKISVIKGKAENVTFPEKLDIIVSEWMGYCLFYESMLQSIIRTRDLWLKEDGLLFPSSASLYMAPFTDVEYTERVNLWYEMKEMYSVSMDSLVPFAKKCLASSLTLKVVSAESIMSHAVKICHFDLKVVTEAQIQDIQHSFSFNCFGQSCIQGFAMWFSVDFPGGITLTTSPYSEQTHWGHSVMYVDEPFNVEQDTIIKGTIRMTPGKRVHRDLDIHLSYQVDNSSIHEKTYGTSSWLTNFIH